MPTLPELYVNGRGHRIDSPSDRPLLEVLREDLELTGTKYGCGEGQCGACTVLIDGRPTRSCLLPVGSVGSKNVTTIEGITPDNGINPLQQAFLDHEAFQCGFCTPGMVVSATALLEQKPNASDSEIQEFMNGNICRCGTYRRILDAIRSAAQSQTRRSA